jgi:hypothetical protein
MDDLEIRLANRLAADQNQGNFDGQAIMVGGNDEQQWNSLIPKEYDGFDPDVPLASGGYTSEHIAYLLRIVGSPGDRLLSMHLNP